MLNLATLSLSWSLGGSEPGFGWVGAVDHQVVGREIEVEFGGLSLSKLQDLFQFPETLVFIGWPHCLVKNLLSFILVSDYLQQIGKATFAPKIVC